MNFDFLLLIQMVGEEKFLKSPRPVEWAAERRRRSGATRFLLLRARYLDAGIGAGRSCDLAAPMRTLRSLAAAIALVSACATACSDREPSVAQHFELERFQGHWFEIARIPRDYDETCHDTTADYTLTAPGTLALYHSCHLGSSTGALSQFSAPATVDDPSVPAKLTLDLGVYRGSYWVLEVADDYSYALVGHPSLTMLWVLSRTPALPDGVYEHLRATASRQGYDPNALVMTPRSD